MNRTFNELGSHVRDDLYVSLRSALIKRPEARMRIISTMGGGEDAPMPAMRRRVLADGEVTRDGCQGSSAPSIYA